LNYLNEFIAESNKEEEDSPVKKPPKPQPEPKKVEIPSKSTSVD